MKYVRLLTISGILVACLLACAARRSGSTLDTGRTQERDELVLLTTRTDAKVSATTTVTDRWRDLRIHWRDYDLSKSPDENGNYPVKSEGWADANEQEKTNKKAEKAERSETGDLIAGTSSRNSSRDTRAQTETGIKAGMQPLWWWLIGVVSVVIVGFVIWWKYGKKDKTK